MKNKFFYLFFCLSFLFVGCDTFFNNVVSEMIDYSVQAFNEDSVILRWDSDTKDARFNIYVKDKDDQVKCLEKKYSKSNYFAVCDSGSSYAVGIIKNGSEIYKTDFVYPSMKKDDGFAVKAAIAKDGLLGVEFFYPSNVDLFSVKGEKEDGETFYTEEYPKEEMKSFMFPIRYDEGSCNNWFTIMFTVDGVEYASAKYYFDYEDHKKAKESGSVTFYPSLD